MRPMAGFDLEATGRDPLTDRIVSAALCRTDAPVRSWLIDPGVPVPDAATAVHGITTDLVRAAGRHPAVALAEIAFVLDGLAADGVPLVVYNAVYDLTLLDRELRRHDLPPVRDDLVVIDPFVIDRHSDPRREGRRTLTDVCAHYGVVLIQAHTADADARAAVEVARALAFRYPKLGALSLPKLHSSQRKWHRQHAREARAFLRRRGIAELVNAQWPRISG